MGQLWSRGGSKDENTSFLINLNDEVLPSS